jgi:Holliday junction resolvasome RuvABC DNA-binding subunit
MWQEEKPQKLKEVLSTISQLGFTNKQAKLSIENIEYLDAERAI